MFNKQLEEIIDKYKITKTDNILYGTNIPMPNLVLPTPCKTYIRFDNVQNYFFYFDENGITLYPLNQDDYVTINWMEVTDFKISNFFIIGKMTIKTKENIYKFQLNNFVIGCPWIKNNRKFLKLNNYFYKKK